MKPQLSILQLAEEVRTEADAYAFLERLRWADGVVICPHCQGERAYFLTPKDDAGRKTRTGATTARRVWKCAACRKQFSVLTGTVMHGTKIPVRSWIFVIFEMCYAKNGVSAREIERKYGIAPRSAWFMTQRIREAMKRDDLVSKMTGTIVADETFVGGKPKNMNRTKRAEIAQRRRAGENVDNKTAVLSLISKETGEVRSRVIPNVTGDTLRSAIREQVEMSATVLHTDSWQGYRQVGAELAGHHYVNHMLGEYVRGDVSTNPAEGYFSQFKRSLDGTHHHVSKEHLHRYLAEFDFRFSTRGMNDTERMGRLLGQVDGRRLTYKRPKS
jgi:transposase-like protein